MLPDTVEDKTAGQYVKVLKGTGTYSLAVLAERTAGFLLLPVYTRFLSPADYGVLELLDLTVAAFGLLFGVRLGQGLLYYYAAAETPRARERFLSTAMAGAWLIGLVIAGMAAFIAPSVSTLLFGTSRYAVYFRLMSVSFGCSLPTEIGLCAMRALDRPWLFTTAACCRLAVAITLNLLFLVGLRLGLAGFVYSSALTSAGMAAAMAWYVLRPMRLSFDFAVLRKLMSYSIPLTISALGMFVIHFGDRFFLRTAVPLDQIGIYALAYKLGMIIAWIQAPFNTYWLSQVFHLIKGPDGSRLYVRVCTYLALGLSASAVLLSAFVRPVLDLAFPESFRAVADYVPWIAAAYVIRAVGDYCRSALLAERRPDLDAAITTVGTITCVAGYVLFIPLWKLWGAVLATGVCFTVMLALSIWKVQHVRFFPFEWRRLACLALCTGAVIAVSTSPVAAAGHVWPGLAIGAALTAGFALSLRLFGFIADEEKRLIRTGLGALWRTMSAVRP